MAKRKKKAWNMSNPLYRYLHGGKKAKAKKPKRRSRGVIMAKRKRAASSRGGFSLMSGVIKTPNMLNKVLVGAGAATIQEKVLPQMFPYQSEAVAFLVAGAPGAAGSFSRNFLKGMQTGSVGGSSPYGN